MTGSRATAPTPTELVAAAVPAAARLFGQHPAAAVVRVDPAEHTRRATAGLAGGVPDHDVLAALMCLPARVAVSVSDIERRHLTPLRRAPAGVVEFTQDWGEPPRVRRLLEPAATVDLVVVRAATWRAGIRRAVFGQFATQVVLLTRHHTPADLAEVAWEADVTGVGLWVVDATGRGCAAAPPPVVEVVAPQPFVLRYVKPARWRFLEHAYDAWRSRHPADDIREGPR